ncbi:DNA translocase FtsK [Patescibacteria group bacterium]|nr:MAG: DNA translocase FtsK [Patescibacteria group bacterium]
MPPSMARRRKRRQQEEEEGRFELDPDTRRGIVAVGLFAASALMFLSFFHIAGSLGGWVDGGLSALFGWDRFLVPVILIIIGATLIFPERGTFSGWNYLGLLCFFLSFNTLLNLILVNRPEPFTADLSAAGGWLGQFLGLALPAAIGYWGSLIVSSSLLVIAVLLAFNTSLRRLAGAHEHLLGWFGARLHRETLAPRDVEIEEGLGEQEELEEQEEELDEEDEEGSEKKPAKPVTMPPGEKALLIKERREVIIPLDLLEKRAGKADAGDIERKIEIIQKTFVQFGIDVEMGETSVGPTVTQFTLRPAQGVKLARIVGLTNDLALALAAHPIRIEAPIPGKALVGIEVPNQTVATVSLRELLESRPFQARASNLALPLGKDVSGNVSVVALDKMPHMLVAGATGSGKSVALNTFIISLLYENGPDDLKLILVDPKRVEMGIYEGIPHLLVPPITKGEDTVNALKWTVREMDRRLDVLAKFGARDIASFNARTEEKMPKVVVIIDELADLMQTSGREVEALVVRIAQMARAVGIHLLLATQRPSVDVITGLIKANVPARVAFAVASQMDSRTILDASGAEKLLGRGDMLFTCAELSKPRRLQGAYVSEDECARVVAFLKKQGVPDYNMAITKPAPGGGSAFDGEGDDDPLLDDAVAVVLQSGKASTSLLQRRLKVGYGRAARIMDLMEERGVIGAGEGAKPREILIDEWPPGGEVETELEKADAEEPSEEESDEDGGEEDGDGTTVVEEGEEEQNKKE